MVELILISLELVCGLFLSPKQSPLKGPKVQVGAGGALANHKKGISGFGVLLI